MDDVKLNMEALVKIHEALRLANELCKLYGFEGSEPETLEGRAYKAICEAWEVTPT